ncbi:MAG TPA: glucose-6-phosphate dehydrogenase, partial [Acidimicrobiales bacterium]|nr:glucose-6-phosphate dehydrogenase [Acidimicrobiales bacterium]
MERRAPPCTLVVFGASGDLTSRKLGPALEALADNRQLPLAFSVVGVARTEMSDEDFRSRMMEVVKKPSAAWERLVAGFRYVSGDYTSPETFEKLRQVLDEVDEERGTAGNRVYYLATVPEVFAGVASALGEHGLSQPSREGAFVRLVVEKPFGRDLHSSHELDETLHQSFREEQLYRIDHYLGKETVQNVLALRFANSIFEPIWNRRYVDHVQITAAETVGVENRGGYYEQAGVVRDMFQNHLLQLLCMIAMEPPVGLDADSVRDEKGKLLKSVRPIAAEEVATAAVRGQYGPGKVAGEELVGYRQEAGVAKNSTTVTYAAIRFFIDNWRWEGVPFYLRSGKRLPKRVTEVAIQFKRPPLLLFKSHAVEDVTPNVLVMRIQPDEGV